nr:tetratricopeptide repeat protein [candidate division Zixibacteria bacterium]
HTRIAFFTTLLFAVHPVHVEAVTWLSARKEVLLGFFSFSSLYFYLMGAGASDGTKKGLLYGLASLCFILAALSKPVAVVLPGLVLLFEVSRKRIGVARFITKFLWFVPAVVFSFLVTYIVVRVMVEAEGIFPYRGGGFLSNFLVAFYLVILNIKLMALTVNYSPLYILSLPYPVIGSWMFVFVLLNLGLIALAVFMFRKNRVFSFAVFWFYISILPYSNIIPISTPFADRYVFVASFAYCLVLALAFERLWSVKLKGFSRDFFPSFTIPLFVLLLAGYSYMTVHQNRIWRDSVTLWSDALAKDPRNNVAMNSLGVIYLNNGMDDKAFELLKKAVEINPIDPLAHNNLAIAYQNLGKYGESEYHFLKALSLKPDLYEPRVNLGNLFVKKGDYDRAIAHFERMLGDTPGNGRIYFWLGDAQEKAGNLDEAIKNYEKSIELSPHVITPYESLGRLYMERLNNREKALYFFREGIQMAPNSRKVREIEDMIKSLM